MATSPHSDPAAPKAHLGKLAHDLRTPLHVILGFAGLLQSGKAGPLTAVQLDYLGNILTSARQLQAIIDDLGVNLGAHPTEGSR